MKPSPSLLAHYLAALNPCRRRTTASRAAGVLEIAGYVFGGALFAAGIYLTVLGCLAVGEILTAAREESSQRSTLNSQLP